MNIDTEDFGNEVVVTIALSPYEDIRVDGMHTDYLWEGSYANYRATHLGTSKFRRWVFK